MTTVNVLHDESGRSVRQWPGIRAESMSCARRQTFPTHTHTSPHVIFVYDGEWTENSQSGPRRLGRGDVLFQPGGFEHQTAAAAGTSVVIMKISPTILAGFCGLYGFYPRSILTSFDDVEGIPERIRAEMERADEATTAVVYSLVLQLLAVGSRARLEANPHTPEWMPRLIAYIQANIGQRLTVRRLAASAGVSESHLSHSFVRYFRCSLSDYIRDCRLRAAVRALRHTEDSIQKIALDTGFSDLAHFCRAFKAARGVTPTQYRSAALLDRAIPQALPPRRESGVVCCMRS